MASSRSTADTSYTQRLVTIESSWWRKYVDPQIPYRWFLKRQQPGFMLEIGCGIGRNLLNNGRQGVGIDHNPTSITLARQRGLTVFTPTDFKTSEFNQEARYDSLLLSHVIEHMTFDEARSLVSSYLKYVKPGGKVILICPQPAGFRADKTHVEYFNLILMSRLAKDLGLTIASEHSFPFPPAIGNVFKYNEWALVARAQKFESK
jgi:2-polyprenyl-3-methyl-5-hydroxy-6-metoxy-1,4-benzoquinol methylase